MNAPRWSWRDDVMFVVLLGKIVMWSVERQDESASDRQRSPIAAHMIRTLLTDSRRLPASASTTRGSNSRAQATFQCPKPCCYHPDWMLQLCILTSNRIRLSIRIVRMHRRLRDRDVSPLTA